MQKETRIGTVTVIISNREQNARNVNDIISGFGEMIIGRMGLPYGPRAIHIIALIVNGTTDDIGALTGRLGAIEGVEVKSALTRS